MRSESFGQEALRLHVAGHAKCAPVVHAEAQLRVSGKRVDVIRVQHPAALPARHAAKVISREYGRPPRTVSSGPARCLVLGGNTAKPTPIKCPAATRKGARSAALARTCWPHFAHGATIHTGGKFHRLSGFTLCVVAPPLANPILATRLAEAMFSLHADTSL